MSDSGSDSGGDAAGGAPIVVRSERGPVTTLTLNRPAARNSLSVAMLDALDGHLADVAERPEVRVVVIAANGPAFSAGHDLRELRDGDAALHREVFARCSAVMQRVAAMPRPVIAAVGGIATAAGCQLVATCDLAVAAESARFATPGVDIGLFCSTPAVAVSRALLPKHTMQLLLTGEPIGAAEAHRMGLVNEVVPDGELSSAVERLADLLAAKPPTVIAAGKAALRAQLGRSLADAYGIATEAMVEGMSRADAAEGIGAFLDKRSPRWPDLEAT